MSESKKTFRVEQCETGTWGAEYEGIDYVCHNYLFGFGQTKDEAIDELIRVTDEIGLVAEAMGYVKLEPGQLVVSEDLCDYCEANNYHRAINYIHLEPGQVVVQTEDLTRIVTWFKGDARTVPHADMDETLGKFQAAIDAAKGE